MKALTLTQPWATLLAIGAKRIETRSWGTAYSGPIAIHAAKGYPKWAREFCLELTKDYVALVGLELPVGAVVATAKLVTCFRIGALTVQAIEEGRVPELATRAGRWDITREEARLGDYAAGRFAWLLADVVPLPRPIPARGALGLWDWEGAA